MPILILNTNVSRSQIPNFLTKELSKIVAEVLCKPESYVTIMINSDVDLIWGGTKEPAAICKLGSIGQISKDQNKKTSKAIQTAIEKLLSIPVCRQYLVFEI
ncbi:Macrophage migration inhibitory factor -like protein [Sarcoptes scabiei]|uniref:L-dopachrome isomerase n=1 Tax=Sarcoptes scabiei TaxID=52283 RepID=A0A834VGM3_SARSC|nr:Macrophage migration inhibitory factor -like protein [Sarcoptes scabiei]